MSVYETLLEYLNNSHPQTRAQAAELVLGSSEDEEFLRGVAAHQDDYARALLRIGSANEAGSEDALSALVNMGVPFASTLGKPSFVHTICEALDEKHHIGPHSHERLLYMLLVNITRERVGVMTLLEQDLFIWRIIQYFATSLETTTSVQQREACDFIGNILINITTVEGGRAWFAELDMSIWECLSAQCTNDARRPVILQITKNLCCDPVAIQKIDLKGCLTLLGRIAYPNAEMRKTMNLNQHALDASQFEGGVVPTQDRFVDMNIESKAMGPPADDLTKKMTASCFTGLFRVAPARNVARELGMYEVLRVWHTVENNEQALEAIENIVHLIHYSEEELAEQDREANAQRLEENRDLKAVTDAGVDGDDVQTDIDLD